MQVPVTTNRCCQNCIPLSSIICSYIKKSFHVQRKAGLRQRFSKSFFSLPVRMFGARLLCHGLSIFYVNTNQKCIAFFVLCTWFGWSLGHQLLFLLTGVILIVSFIADRFRLFSLKVLVSNYVSLIVLHGYHPVAKPRMCILIGENTSTNGL